MKTNVAVVFGGRSVEHEVAIISAIQAISNMDKEKYNIVPVYITKNGDAVYDQSFLNIDTFRAKDLNSFASKYTCVVFGKDKDGFCIYPKQTGIGKRKPIATVDIVFPIVHGTNCEDGTISGLCEFYGVPYVGCDIMSASLGMDKDLFKRVLTSSGIPTLSHFSFYGRQWSSDKDAIIAQIENNIGYPVIVKPANLGSSVGISKAADRDKLIESIDTATSFASKILVEHAVTNLREINCSVLGDSDECRASEVEEPVMQDEILSYQDKYISNGSKGSKGMSSLKRKLPADISDEKKSEIQKISCDTFRLIGASGVVRIDFLVDCDDNDKVYVNEINTIPGSLAFYLWGATGLKYKDLLDELISLGFKRARNKNNLSFTFDTNILEGTGSFGAKGAKGSKF